jgi:hypothetical protein
MRSDGKGRAGTDCGGCAGSAQVPFPGRREGENEGLAFGYCPLTPGMTRVPYASMVASWASCMS